MLVNFKMKNFRSFYNESILSMEATKDKEFSEINTFFVEKNLLEKNNNELLKSAVIFGGNASGKSNVIKAITYMRNLVFLSPSFNLVANNETFALYDYAKNDESLYEIEFISNNTFYRYGFTIKSGIIEREWLYRRKERLTQVFRREQNQIEILGLSKEASKFLALNKNILFISIANNFNLPIHQEIKDVKNWFDRLLIVFETDVNSFDIYSLKNGKYKDQALKILKLADIGIDNISIKKDKIVNVKDQQDVFRYLTEIQTKPIKLGQIQQEDFNIYNIDMKTFFNVYDKKNKPVNKKEIMLIKDRGFNSEGTERLISYLGWILAALDEERVILIDEIDSKLHFLVADYLISLFNSIDKNPKNSQLVCTAHNVMLMDEDIRRDQIYFTSKNYEGSSCLVSLSDFKNVRKRDLFSKKYLSGFYSKLPDMTKEI